jgi:glucokinase
VIDGPDVAKRAGLDQGLLLNDFEAQALSLPVLDESWARQIGPLKFGPAGPQVILGPGTGLGIGALLHVGGRYTPVSSEACHIDFGPVSAEETAIWPHLERAFGRVTTESVISGAGLARVHNARLAATGAALSTLDAAGVTTAAIVNPSGPEGQSVKLFWRIAARFAGDMAVTFVAEGGVTLAGGVLPRIVDFLDDATFRAAFEAKAPVDRLAKAIPTRLLTKADSVLAGMAAIGGEPHRYLIDYETRGWR